MTSWREFGEPAIDRGLLLGDGLFETVLVADGRPCFLARHLARLRASCAALGVPFPDRIEPLVRAALPELWREEQEPPRAALRVVVTRGPWLGPVLPPRDLPGLYVVLRSMDASPAVPLHAVVVDAPRIDPANPLAGHKTLSWMAFVEARRRASAAGAQMALLRTTEGDVAEADAANLFLVLGGRLVTPPLSRGVLPGITRARVLDAARSAGLATDERPVTDADLRRADEAFLTSSLAGVVPLARIDDRRLEAPGTVTRSLAEAVPASAGDSGEG